MSSPEIVAEFEPARESVRWAKDAIDELRAAFKSFLQGGNNGIVTEIDPQSGERVQKLRFNERIPSVLARRATEALTAARHAFDQAAFAARNITSGKSNESIYYPWAQSPTDLDHLLKSRRIDQRLWGVFKGHEPYPRSNAYAGGNDVIRALAKLANNKHTVGLTVVGHIVSTRYPNLHGRVVKNLEMPIPRWDAQKGEAELLRWDGDVELNGHYEFTFEVVLNDPVLPKPVNACGALAEFAMRADQAIETLQAACLNLPR